MQSTITSKQLRNNMQQVLEEVSEGAVYTVIYRSVPKMVLMPIDGRVEGTLSDNKKKKWFDKIDNAVGIGTADNVSSANNDKNVLRERLKKKYGK